MRSRVPARATRLCRSTFALTLALIVLLVSMSGATESKAKKTRSTSLADSLTQLLKRSELKGAAVGAHVVNLADGKTIYERDADRLLIPASNTKLFTTAAALSMLGKDFEFRTVVGICDDDLVVLGSGDPSIGGRFTGGDPTAYFRQWAKLLRDQNITLLDDVVLDDSLFDQQWVHPNWSKNDLSRWYAAPVGAIALNDSCVDVRIGPGSKVDSAAQITLIPRASPFRVDNQSRTVGTVKQHAPRVHRRPGQDVILCEGGVYSGAQPLTTWIPVDDPGLFFGRVLLAVLDEEGIRVKGTVRRELGIASSEQFEPRLNHRFSLIPTLAVTNKESQNFYAEQILKTIAAQRGEGSWREGKRVANEALKRLGVDLKSFVLDDGCGLSRENRATARSFTTLLSRMHSQPEGKIYRETLAIAGTDGTIERRLTGEKYRGRIWAKTGSITGVRSISGYVHTRSGRWLAFSLIVNNPRASVRTIQDEFLKRLVDS